MSKKKLNNNKTPSKIHKKSSKSIHHKKIDSVESKKKSTKSIHNKKIVSNKPNKNSSISVKKHHIKRIIKKETTKNPKTYSFILWGWTLAIITVAIVLLLYLNNKQSNSFNPETPVKIEFFVRSSGAIDKQSEDLLFPKINAFGNDIELHVNYIGDPKDLSSINGIQEINEDLIQLCFQKNYPNLIDDFILCRNKDVSKDWKECVNNDTLIIEQCIKSNEGQDLLKNSFEYSKKKGISVSPTIYLNNKRILYYPGTNYFERSICKVINKSEICSKLPEENVVNLIVVNDMRCKDCDVSSYVSKLKQIFTNLNVKEYDINQKEGKDIFDKTSSIYLPLITFDNSILTANGFNQISHWLEKHGEYYILKIDSKFNPNKEICDNNIDDTKNGLIDCVDPDCKNSLICRRNIPNKLDLYIMSDCPYGKEAIKVAKPIIDNFGRNIDFSVHYIASEKPDGTFTSLHGNYEAKEDMRQLCIIKHYPKNWFNYILCRSKEGIKGKDWRNCADANSMNNDLIQNCVNNEEGKTLLSKDIKIAQSIGISRSPTWLANNKYKFSGLNSESVKNQFCNYNSLKPCENRLDTNSNALPSSCG